jgi:hypothetical protein
VVQMAHVLYRRGDWSLDDGPGAQHGLRVSAAGQASGFFAFERAVGKCLYLLPEMVD